jgi:hypothetical protein
MISRTITGQLHRDDVHGDKPAHNAGMEDQIIDRSPEQKRIRMERLRVELAELGYSVVTTKWLHAMLATVDFYTGSRALEAAE